jgi:hypothetical protein
MAKPTSFEGSFQNIQELLKRQQAFDTNIEKKEDALKVDAIKENLD